MDTPFGKNIATYIEKAIKSIDDTNAKVEIVEKKFKEVVDYYMIDSGDEMSSKSEKLLAFFN